MQPAPTQAPDQPAQKGPDIHDLALTAYQAGEKLNTALAQAGVDPSVNDAVSKATDVFHKVASALGKGQATTGDNAPAAPALPSQRPTMDQGVAAVHQTMQHAARPQGGGY